MERFAKRYFMPSNTATGSNVYQMGIRLHRLSAIASMQQRLSKTSAVKRLSSTNNAADLPYGLKRIDYSSLPPLTHNSRPLYTLPPPPPHLYNPKNTVFKSTIQPMLAPICVAILIGSTIYLYLYPEKEVFEYWKQVEQGDVPVGNDYDDDDDDDDDDSDEWEDE